MLAYFNDKLAQHALDESGDCGDASMGSLIDAANSKKTMITARCVCVCVYVCVCVCVCVYVCMVDGCVCLVRTHEAFLVC